MVIVTIFDLPRTRPLISCVTGPRPECLRNSVAEPALNYAVKDNASLMPLGNFLERVTEIRQDERGMFP